jgi:hypothetical protein
MCRIRRRPKAFDGSGIMSVFKGIVFYGGR